MFIDPVDSLLESRIVELEEIARNKFLPKRKYYHDNHLMPYDNIDAISSAGLLNAMLPEKYNGINSNLFSNDPATYLQAIRVIARSCSSTAHMFQVHNHSSYIINQIGSEYQRDTFLPNDGNLVATVGSEPNRRSMYKFSTTAKKVAGGYIINGEKTYATNGLMLKAAIIMASDSDTDEVVLLIVTPDQKGIIIDNSWYVPAGMRSARSPRLLLDNVFVEDKNVLGTNDAYVKEKFQAQFHLGFTANYLGTIEGMFAWFVDYMHNRNKTNDPFIQRHTGEMYSDLLAAQNMFHETIRSWKTKPVTEAEVASIATKTFVGKTALNIAQQIVKCAGTQATFETEPLSIYLADLQTHISHSGHDKSYQIVGQSRLGKKFDTTLQR